MTNVLTWLRDVDDRAVAECFRRDMLTDAGLMMDATCPDCGHMVADHLTKAKYKLIRQHVGDTYGWRCRYCGVGLSGGAELEHVVPQIKARYGPDLHRATNYVLSCRPCNLSKGSLDPIRWLERLKAKGELDRAPLLPGLIVEMLQSIDGPTWNPRSDEPPPLDLKAWLKRPDDDPPELNRSDS